MLNLAFLKKQVELNCFGYEMKKASENQRLLFVAETGIEPVTSGL